MLNVGLTGNAASGKSTVARYFATWGATVLDADALAREVQQPGTPTFHAIVRRFGTAVQLADGSLDRARLRRRVLDDPQALADLNALVHPAVRARRAAHVAAARQRGDAILVHEIPLLFEVLDPAEFDLVVLVDAPEAIRRPRLLTARALPQDEADRLLAVQLPSDAKRERSGIVIDNTGSLAALEQAANAAWLRIRSQAARPAAGNVRPLLVVVAHAADALLMAGGTMGRMSDGGVAVHVCCLAADIPPSDCPLEHVTFHALRSAADAEATVAAAARDVLAFIERSAPAVLVCFGPDGVNGHPEHVTAHRVAQRAWAESHRSVARLYLTDAPSPTTGACVDVRPWADLKRRATAGVVASCGLCARRDGQVGMALDREWYVTPEPLQQPLPQPFVRPG